MIIIGTGPFDFTYAIDGVPQTPVTGYNGPSPYVFGTNIPGTYTLVSLSNPACSGPNTISGSATVIVHALLPVSISISPSTNSFCEGTVVTFSSCFDTITTTKAKPYKLKGGIPLGGTYSGPCVNASTGVFTASIAGVGVKTIIYSCTNVYSCTMSNTRKIKAWVYGMNDPDPSVSLYPSLRANTFSVRCIED